MLYAMGGLTYALIFECFIKYIFKQIHFFLNLYWSWHNISHKKQIFKQEKINNC